jgi:hypothetical protein
MVALSGRSGIFNIGGCFREKGWEGGKIILDNVPFLKYLF